MTFRHLKIWCWMKCRIHLRTLPTSKIYPKVRKKCRKKVWPPSNISYNIFGKIREKFDDGSICGVFASDIWEIRTFLETFRMFEPRFEFFSRNSIRMFTKWKSQNRKFWKSKRQKNEFRNVGWNFAQMTFLQHFEFFWRHTFRTRNVGRSCRIHLRRPLHTPILSADTKTKVRKKPVDS